MKYRVILSAFVLSASLVYGQLDSNTITVTATRNTPLQADQAVFSVSVNSDVNTSFDDVVAALAPAGITSANFSGLGRGVPALVVIQPFPPVTTPLPNISWSFTLPVPLSKIKDTVATLTTLQKSITQNNSGLTLSFIIVGTQVSPQLQQMQTCPIPDLLSDARTEAQKLADAAHLFLGSVLAMSSLTTPVIPSCALTVKFAVTR